MIGLFVLYTPHAAPKGFGTLCGAHIVGLYKRTFPLLYAPGIIPAKNA